uniref:Major capsid protein N-terminal domain-containing protein n=1 Tax=viral metagenome TaxID=1070528 RepID=A0A6C0K9H1_9ZZZZ
MGGGLLQLVAYGAQDVYLTGNPQITFFKVVYRRHTNFAIEAIQQTFNGTVGYGQTVNCQISRNGDLINRVYLQVALPKITGIDNLNAFNNVGARYVNYIGLRLIKSVLIEIGGQQIDKHYSDWLYIWNELSLPRGKRYGYDTMVGADKDITSFNNTTLYIPLEFWFCRNVGLALPLIALQYHEVKIKIDFETKEKCLFSSKAPGATSDTEVYDSSNPPAGTVADITDMSLWVDYIFLDTDERRRFAQLSHEYLIEQLQFTGTETLNGGATNRVKLNFNHPCKELIWVAKPNNFARKACWYNYTSVDNVDLTRDIVSAQLPVSIVGNTNITNFSSSNYMAGFNFGDSNLSQIAASSPFADTILQLNGNDRFSVRDGTYFSFVQPYQHHTNIPSNPGINVYSFALKPEDHQPSGTLNMSRIDTATLMVTTKTDLKSSFTGTPALTYDGINIYAVNYNVLRILSGMGGLAYSN